MTPGLTPLDPPATEGEVPATFPSPFDQVGPHPLVLRAAEALKARLRGGTIAPGLSSASLAGPGAGKMFGVLVVRAPDGQVGALEAFSGMLDGRWEVEGFAPPLFDAAQRAEVEPAGEARVKQVHRRFEALAADPELARLREAHAEQSRRQSSELAALRALHLANRRERQAQRDALEVGRPRLRSGRTELGFGQTESCIAESEAPAVRREVSEAPPVRREVSEAAPVHREVSEAAPVHREGSEPPPVHPERSEAKSRGPSSLDVHPERAAALHALDQQSRGDKAERRRLEAGHEEERETLHRALRPLERRLAAAMRLRRIVSRAVMRQLHDTYRVRNAKGEVRPLRSLYAPAEPPSGAGDCAAPRLLAYAFEQGLTPLALCEFWWGAPPLSQGRVEGAFYPPCREKCGPLVPFMLEGLSVAAPRAFVPPDRRAAALTIVYEDANLVVVDKPAGLLSVPGKDEAVNDSVQARLRARYPAATGPLIVHRLDLDTSGLLVAALDAATYAALQRQFTAREVHKRYEAWVEGDVAGEAGTIDLALRVDLDDRPRQIHDAVHGRRAVTRWQVLERAGGRTRLALFPLTGRTHQLRVHAAHPLGLGAAIVGDRLYGLPAERLMLDAQVLAFVHPATGQRLSFERPAPF